MKIAIVTTNIDRDINGQLADSLEDDGENVAVWRDREKKIARLTTAQRKGSKRVKVSSMEVQARIDELKLENFEFLVQLRNKSAASGLQSKLQAQFSQLPKVAVHPVSGTHYLAHLGGDRVSDPHLLVDYGHSSAPQLRTRGCHGKHCGGA
jgi:hypothetical protein